MLGVALNTAHRDDRLRLNFQPVVRAIQPAEALPVLAVIRFWAPVLPDEFILLAEESADHIPRLVSLCASSPDRRPVC